jgi:hypothetical protein
MEALHETPATSAHLRFASDATRSAEASGEKPNPKLRRQQEIFAWIVIAAIWGTFALSLYLICVKASGN